MKHYQQHELINSLSLLKKDEALFLLGAGCSITSGCMSATKLVNEFKKRIYCAKNGVHFDEHSLLNDSKFMALVNMQEMETVENPYSYYFEKCFSAQFERNKFIKEKFEQIKPSYGYLCFADYVITHNIRYVLTTNFDKLVEKAIRKLDENYDLSVSSDSITPNMQTSLNLIKLHGDYNYDNLRNTKDELNTISEKLKQEILRIHTRKIIVIGYSGQDKSVMGALYEYLSLNPQTELIWCMLDFSQNNTMIERLCSFNDNSGVCHINGFDEIFMNYYKSYGSPNSQLQQAYINDSDNVFKLKAINQPEMLRFNCYPIENNPLINKVDLRLSYSEAKEINNKVNNFIVLPYKGHTYFIGNKTEVSKFFKLSESQISDISLCEENIPTTIKCKIIKEIIKLSLKKAGIAVCRDNIYKRNNEIIQEGLKITVELFNEKICVIFSCNYFIDSDEIVDNNIKYQINRKKSSLFALENHKKLELLLKTLCPRDMSFNVENSLLSLSTIPYGTGKNCLLFHKYNCADEPIMIVEKRKSANQIKLVTESGPKETLFSTNCIRVGVFCAEEDKDKLKEYLDYLLNGTRKNGCDIIPQYKGFEITFKKNIEFIYDILPPFSTKISHNPKNGFYEFASFCMRGIKKMYDEKQIDIALVYIGNGFKKYRSDGEKDLHDYIKLLCANKYKTQFLEENTLYSSDNINKKILNLAVGIFTKTIGMPWYPENYSKNTLFLGLSFGVDSKGINVGCSQMFDGAGRGMQLIISQVTDKHKKNQFLSKEEAYNLGIKIRQTYYKTSRIDELKRIVIHRTDPFVKEEIEGFKMAFEGIDDFDLIQVIDRSNFNSYRIKNGYCDGYPVQRGTTIQATTNTAYVWTDGSISDGDILKGKNYRNSKRGMGSPLKIKKYHGAIALNEAVDDLMYLTKMDFNSSDVIYSKMPVTIKYARMVCDLLKQGNFDDDLISFEYIM